MLYTQFSLYTSTPSLSPLYGPMSDTIVGIFVIVYSNHLTRERASLNCESIRGARPTSYPWSASSLGNVISLLGLPAHQDSAGFISQFFLGTFLKCFGNMCPTKENTTSGLVCITLV